MKVYRTVWLAACAAAVLAGAGIGLVRSPANLAGTFVACAALAAIWSLVAGRYQKRGPRAPSRHLIGIALGGGAVAGAIVGLAEAMGVGVLALAIVLLAASPHVLRTYARALTSAPVSLAAGLGAWVTPPICGAPHAELAPFPPNVGLLTDQRLRTLWRTSFLAVQTRPRSSEIAAIVEERQRYLDEFERRNPGGFQAWLARGAWPSNIPVTYLRDARTPDPGINWDELTRQRDS